MILNLSFTATTAPLRRSAARIHRTALIMRETGSKRRLECQFCGTAFGYQSSLVRHLRNKCNRDAPNTRRKSCAQCVADKTRCSLERPTCARCIDRGTACQYSTPHPSTTAAARGVDLSSLMAADGPSLAHDLPPPSWTQDALMPDPFLAGLDDLDVLPLPPLTAQTGMVLMNPARVQRSDDSSPESIDFLADPYSLVPQMTTPSAALTRHSMEFIFRVLRSWPSMLADDFEVPPILHESHLTEDPLPQPLANCITLCKMWHGQRAGTVDIVRTTVLKEVNYILEKYPTYDEANLRAVLQALVIYTIILIFPAKRGLEPLSSDSTIFVKIHHLMQHVVTAGLLLPEEREQRVPSWEAWIHMTTKRRAVLGLYLLHWAFAVYHQVSSYNCRDLSYVPAPAPKALWMATSADHFHSTYIRWLARWNGHAYRQGEFDKIRPGIVMDARAERWLEETDEFGFIMMAIVNATEYAPAKPFLVVEQ